jgi:hypothetical protein
MAVWKPILSARDIIDKIISGIHSLYSSYSLFSGGMIVPGSSFNDSPENTFFPRDMSFIRPAGKVLGIAEPAISKSESESDVE